MIWFLLHSINLPLGLSSFSYSECVSDSFFPAYCKHPSPSLVVPWSLPHPPTDLPPLCQRIRAYTSSKRTSPYDLEIIHQWSNMPRAMQWLRGETFIFVSPLHLKLHNAKKTWMRKSSWKINRREADRWFGFLQGLVVFWDVWTFWWLSGPLCISERLTASTGAGGCVPWRIDLCWTGDERGEAKGARETTDF